MRQLELVRAFAYPSAGFLVLLLGLIFTAAATAAPSVTKPSKPESFIELKAKTSMFGNVTFLIAPKQVVTKCFTGSSIWSSRKPEQVQLVHPEAGCYLNVATKDWIIRKRGGIDKVTIASVVKLGEEKVANQACVHYRGYQTKEANKSSPSIEFWSIAKPPCDKVTIEYFCSMFSVPSQYGLPIKVKQVSAGKLGMTLATVTFVTKPLSVKDFALPSGYRQVKDMGSFYFAEKGDSLEASELNNYFRSDR